MLIKITKICPQNGPFRPVFRAEKFFGPKRPVFPETPPAGENVGPAGKNG